MKILHLLGDRKLPRDPAKEGASGLVRAVLEIARHQVELGHKTAIAVVSMDAWRSEWMGVQLLGLPMIPWARVSMDGRVLDFRLHLPYFILTRRKSFDIVHGHLYSYLRFLRAKRRVVHFHSDPFYKGRENEGIDLKSEDFAHIARHSDAQIAVSQFIAGELEKGFRSQSNVQVVYNGVDAKLFEPSYWQEARTLRRKEWGMGDSDVLFLFAGALVPEKGVIHLARAFARLAATTPWVHLAIAGTARLWGGTLSPQQSGDYEQEVEQILRDVSFAGRLHFLGKVATSEMPTVYAASDVVIIPSVWREPFPLVALESLAAGRPVIASRIGGLVEIVNEHNGILVPPGDEGEIGRAMSILAENTSLRRRLGQVARKQAKSFSWHRAAQQLDQIYRKLLGLES